MLNFRPEYIPNFREGVPAAPLSYDERMEIVRAMLTDIHAEYAEAAEMGRHE